MATDIYCPVEVYPGRATNRTNLWVHFMHLHVKNTIVVLNKVPVPHPCCNQCYLFIPRGAMVAGYLGTAIYKRGLKQNIRHHHPGSGGGGVTGTVPGGLEGVHLQVTGQYADLRRHRLSQVALEPPEIVEEMGTVLLSDMSR